MTHTTGNFDRVAQVLDHAASLRGADRAAYLREACGEDDALRAEVDSLLAARSEQGKFLAEPTQGHAVEFDDQTIKATPREQPGTRIGPYKLLQLIGEGGFGSVFMAEQEKPVARKVALKIIKLGMDTRAVIARFEAERQALAMMDHPNIARVLDAGATETGRPYFVMDLCKGDPVIEYCDKNSLSIQDRLELFVQCCQAVQHAHTKGIIHRDVKPSNILVSTQDGRPHAKVIDFGIAKATASRLTEKTLFTEHRALIGTPEYMSPEQAEGSLDIDTRTDVYSLGVLLYELLTGTTPFSGRELRSAAYAEIQRIIREVEPLKPSTRLSRETNTLASVAAHRHTEPRKLGSIIRGDLDWIVMKALEKDRSRRYETANGLAMDVRRYLSREAVLAAPPSPAYRISKFVGRNRAQVVAAALITLALLLGMAGTAWQAKVASDRAAVAQMAEGEAQAARDGEKARADELKKVSDFLAKMLVQADPTTAGVRLTEDVNRRFAAARAKANVPEAERLEQADAFRAAWAQVNATDAALALIDEAILKPAVKAIGEQFKDQPIVDAQLRQVLADRYRDLGLLDAAFPLQESAVKTRRRVLGEEHPETLISLCNMGRLFNAQGKLAEAESYCREAMEKSRRVLGNEHPDTLNTIGLMGVLLERQGKYSDAEPYVREALEKRRKVLGNEHADTLKSIAFTGFLLQDQGRLTEAEPYCREAMETSRRVLGEEHPDTLKSINNMALLLDSQGKLSEAEPYFREVLEKSRRVLGQEHPFTLISIGNMGYLLGSQGRFAEAELYTRECLEADRRVLGEDHPETLISINNMGYLYSAQGKLAEAEPYTREAMERTRRVRGPEHPETITSTSNLGVLLRELGRLAEAEPFCREALETSRRVLGAEHPTTLISIISLGSLRRAQGRHQEAIDLLGQAEPAVRKAFSGTNAWRLGILLANLGRAHIGFGYDADRFELAEANLLEAHPIFIKDRGEKHKDTLDCVKGLVDLYSAWDKAEPGKGYAAKAAEWKTRLEASQAATQTATQIATQPAVSAP